MPQKFLPKNELDDVVKSSYEKIWKFRRQENENWEDRIIATFSYLQKRNRTFSKFVNFDDYWDIIDRMYHDKNSFSEFKEKIIRNLCRFETFNFYFEIPRLYNFSKKVKLGKCICYAFSELPLKIQREFIDWTEMAYPYVDENKISKKERLEFLSQFLFLKIQLVGIGDRISLENANEIVDSHLNIFRYLFDADIQTTLVVGENVTRKIVDGPFGKWNYISNNNWALGRYDEFFYDEIKFLSDIFKKNKPVELDLRIKEAVNMYGISFTIHYPPLKLITLCSGLESLVVTEKRGKGKQISKRVSSLLDKSNNSEVKSDLILLYNKRSESVHGFDKNAISKYEVKKCQKYLKQAIKKMLEFRKNGYSNLRGRNATKSLCYNFGW